LPSAHIGFLDELFRGSSAILNSLLTLLNERTFNNGKENIQTPIQSIIAATNSWPNEESLQAFADRFLFRPTVDLLKKPVSKRILDEWSLGLAQRPEAKEHLTLQDLTDLQTFASQLPVTEDFLDQYGSVWDMLASRNITVSDRRRSQILKFLKAWAVVQGDDQLHPSHMHGSLIHIVYQDREDQEAIQEVLEQVIPTAEKTLNDAKRAAAGIMAEANAYSHKHRSNELRDLNEYVLHLRKWHKDITTVRDKATEVLDGGQYKVSASTRAAGVKIIQNIQSQCDSLAKAINEISN